MPDTTRFCFQLLKDYCSALLKSKYQQTPSCPLSVWQSSGTPCFSLPTLITGMLNSKSSWFFLCLRAWSWKTTFKARWQLSFWGGTLNNLLAVVIYRSIPQVCLPCSTHPALALLVPPSLPPSLFGLCCCLFISASAGGGQSLHCLVHTAMVSYTACFPSASLLYPWWYFYMVVLLYPWWYSQCHPTLEVQRDSKGHHLHFSAFLNVPPYHEEIWRLFLSWGSRKCTGYEALLAVVITLRPFYRKIMEDASIRSISTPQTPASKRCTAEMTPISPSSCSDCPQPTEKYPVPPWCFNHLCYCWAWGEINP